MYSRYLLNIKFYFTTEISRKLKLQNELVFFSVSSPLLLLSVARQPLPVLHTPDIVYIFSDIPGKGRNSPAIFHLNKEQKKKTNEIKENFFKFGLDVADSHKRSSAMQRENWIAGSISTVKLTHTAQTVEDMLPASCLSSLFKHRHERKMST